MDLWEPYVKLAEAIFGESFDELEKERGEIDKSALGSGIDYALLKYLPVRERKIISMRFGLRDGKPLAYKQIGAYWQITKSRVSQIIVEVFGKLRHPEIFGGKGLLRAARGSDLYRMSWPEEPPESRGMYPNPAVVQLTWGVFDVWKSRPSYWNAGRPLRGTVGGVVERLNREVFGRADGPLDRKFLELHITKAFLELEPFDLAVMCYRYGFITGKRLILPEAGRMCGVKGHRVSYIQKKCVPQLAEAMRKSMVQELKHEKGLPVVLPDPAPREKVVNVYSPPNWGRM